MDPFLLIVAFVIWAIANAAKSQKRRRGGGEEVGLPEAEERVSDWVEEGQRRALEALHRWEERQRQLEAAKRPEQGPAQEPEEARSLERVEPADWLPHRRPTPGAAALARSRAPALARARTAALSEAAAPAPPAPAPPAPARRAAGGTLELAPHRRPRAKPGIRLAGRLARVTSLQRAVVLAEALREPVALRAPELPGDR